MASVVNIEMTLPVGTVTEAPILYELESEVLSDNKQSGIGGNTIEAGISYPQATRPVHFLMDHPSQDTTCYYDTPQCVPAPPVPLRRPQTGLERKPSWATQRDIPMGTPEVLRQAIERQRLHEQLCTEIAESRHEELFAPKAAFQDAQIFPGIWDKISRLFNCCIPESLIELKLGDSAQSPIVKQAWRKKMSLFILLTGVWISLGYLVFHFGFLKNYRALESVSYDDYSLKNAIILDGIAYYYQASHLSNFDLIGQIANAEFPTNLGSCLKVKLPRSAYCSGTSGKCRDPQHLAQLQSKVVSFPWLSITPESSLVVFDGAVLDMNFYLKRDGGFLGHDFNQFIKSHMGQDITRSTQRHDSTREAIDCLATLYRVGFVGLNSLSFTFANIVSSLLTMLCLTTVMVKFIVGQIYKWNLTRTLKKADFSIKMLNTEAKYILIFLLCSSESESSLRQTLDSIANTNYNDQRKVLLIVVDGGVQSKSSHQKTSEVLLGLLNISNIQKSTVEPRFYACLEREGRGCNRAYVYSGYYNSQSRSVPVVLIVKCGTISEVSFAEKPGFRGRRDSLHILLNLLSAIECNDRISDLDYAIYNAFRSVTGGTTIDACEYLLMVDGITQICPESLPRLVACLEQDKTAMGVCGEVKVANRYDSWISRIQVFEYMVRFHYGKLFESSLGRVTCLPSNFSLWRLGTFGTIKGTWIPILTHPTIVGGLEQVNFHTLCQKDLPVEVELDHFFTTLMLRTFPRKRTVFLPSAFSQTLVPSSLADLISQRRLYTSSKFCNLLALLWPPQRVGFFCYFIEFNAIVGLLSIITSPILIFTICLTSINIFLGKYTLMNLILEVILLTILVLPSLLVTLTCRRISYVGWMVVYLVSLPIWLVLLPFCAFWNFDEFDWIQSPLVKNRKIAKPPPVKVDNDLSLMLPPLRHLAEYEQKLPPPVKKSEGLNFDDKYNQVDCLNV